jgi:hypothetical protein
MVAGVLCGLVDAVSGHAMCDAPNICTAQKRVKFYVAMQHCDMFAGRRPVVDQPLTTLVKVVLIAVA